MGGGAAADEPERNSFFDNFCMCGRDDVVEKETAPDGAQSAADGGAGGEEVIEPPPPSEASVVAAKNDQIFDDFKAKLLEGIPLVKHCKDKQARKRIVYVDPSFTKLGWYEAGKTTRKQYPIAKITEVRKATDVDPSTNGGTPMSGTPILRGSMHVAYKNMAFSLILTERSLDLQCESEAQCQTLVTCFNRLIKESA